MQVEQFKQDPSPTKCLHSVFNVDTGDEVHAYGDYHHLQVSVTALSGQRLDSTVNRVETTHECACTDQLQEFAFLALLDLDKVLN